MGSYAVPQYSEFAAMQGLTEQEQVIFLGQYNAVRKDATVAVLLAFFLGSFGAHRFYLGQIGLGVLYLVFCWTLIPHLIAFVECFLLPGRVRAYNAEQAAWIGSQLRGGSGAMPPRLMRR